MSFKLRKLKVTGALVKDAVIIFYDGLNVITGPSETGKSYIFQCINFMLGAKASPKSIKQAKGYSEIFLEIETTAGKKFTLESGLKGGNIKLYETSIDNISGQTDYRTINRKHSSTNKDNISSFLLELNNLSEVKIRVNANGSKHDVSYRDVAKFLLIDEMSITTDKSPIISDNYTTVTKQKSLLKFLLTGVDDSSIIEGLTKDQVINRKGKVELLTELIGNLSSSLPSFSKDYSQLIDEANREIHTLSSEHGTLKDIFIELDNSRKQFVHLLSEKETQEIYYTELLSRSQILKEQYASDISRLKATIEASLLLSSDHTFDSICPLCKSNFKEKCSDDDIVRIIESCEAEIAKIVALNTETFQSEELIKNEVIILNTSINMLNTTLESIVSKMDDNLSLKMSTIIKELNIINIRKNKLLQENYVNNNIQDLIRQKKYLETSFVPTSNAFEQISTSLMHELSDAIKIVLSGCNYPDLSSVSFSEGKTDFVISGQDRELSGKGFRAITYSAFVVALQELMHDKTYSLGTPVLDSPLVTYKPNNESNDGVIPDNLAMDFYRYVAKSKKIKQLVILENDEPPEDTDIFIHHTKFTRSPYVGRYGFFPTEGISTE